MVKFGALLFVLSLDRQNAINFQLLGGVWILQTFLAIVARPLHPLVPPVGAAGRLGRRHGLRHRRRRTGRAAPATKHFGSSLDEVPFVGKLGYIALTAFVINLVVAVVLTFVFRAMKAPDGVDQTEPSDYYADEGDPRVQPIDELTADSSRAST